MLILLGVAFISGLITILAPCVWPLLPVILSVSSTGGRRRPLGITVGIIVSFSLFTLTLSYLVMLFHLSPGILRVIAVIVLCVIGISMLIPGVLSRLETAMSRMSGRFSISSKKGSGFGSGFLTGLSLGVVWTPCAGPILATIATLAATRTVSFQAVLITLSYAGGVGIPLFLFASWGKYVFTKSRLLSAYTVRAQQVFGIIVLLTALAIFTGYDQLLEVHLLNALPSYTNVLTSLETSSFVQRQLAALKQVKNTVKIATPFSGTLSNYGDMPEFPLDVQWLNTSSPLTAASLRGKVVLIDFWTYTCINCIRTLPFVKSWYDKYKDAGLVVIGVHTPEFEFEKQTANVKDAIKRFGIDYPVVQDNDYTIWNSYNNAYWPAEYLIDGQGHIRREHFGEGEYAESEKAIQELLMENGKKINSTLVNLPDSTPQSELTPETYFGSSRIERLSSPEQILLNGEQQFSWPNSLGSDEFAYKGKWNIQSQYAEARNGDELEFNFSADKVYAVLTPTGLQDGITVLLDGEKIPQDVAGTDVKQGMLIIDPTNPARAYNIVDFHGHSGRHTLILQFQSSGTQLYTVTFG